MSLYPEWLETDGRGGFAMGSVDGIPRRRYHSLLVASMKPPTERINLVNTIEVFVYGKKGRYPLSSFHYSPDVEHPPLGLRKSTYLPDRPFPTWLHELPEGITLEQCIFMQKGEPTTFVSWKLISGNENLRLTARPLISGRNYHWLNRANDFLRLESHVSGELVRWQPYDGIPAINARSNGSFTYSPVWYYDFLYDEERARGFDALEDLASPGEFSWTLNKGQEAVLIFSADIGGSTQDTSKSESVNDRYRATRESELRRREAFPSLLERSADAYIVDRGSAKTLIAGYPWFTDWGRDTFISIRGLCLETGRLKEAEGIFLAWINAMKDGMIPNCFPDEGNEPEFNSVDASLWFVISASEFLEKCAAKSFALMPRTKERIQDAMLSVLESYYDGARYYIQADKEDGLLYAGSFNTQLTWMDAAFSGYAFTPRAGKPVEIQALWINALLIGARLKKKWADIAALAQISFESRFWNELDNCLFDVVDVNGSKNVVDPRVRPNQIFAVGGLPVQILKGDKAASVVATVQKHLLTPLGLRSLAPFEREYHSFYQGGDYDRCAAYHQGTVWTWLMGAFIEAFVRVNGSTDKAKKDASKFFFEPLLANLGKAGIGHLPEIADGNEPYFPRGCSFQAWSIAEALRIQKAVLG